MKLRVWVEKLMLVRHIRSLEDTTIARQVYEEQKCHGWPGLVRETAPICSRLGIEDGNEVAMERWSTKEYRKLVLEACRKHDEAELREAARGQRKCQRIMEEEYGRKKYMGQKTLKDVRSLFLTRVQMQPFAGNFTHDKKFQGTNWLCACGESWEEEAHLLCTGT